MTKARDSESMNKEIDEKNARFLEMVRATGKEGWSSMSAEEWDALIPPAGFVDLDGNPIDISTEEGTRKLTELMSEPTAEEIVFYDERQCRALGVGTDESGNIVTAATDKNVQERIEENRQKFLAKVEARTDMLTVSQVAELLRVSVPEVAEMEAQNRFFGYETGDGWRYPAFQFDREGGKSYAILERILTEAVDMLPVLLMKFFMTDNWSLTSDYGDFIYGNRKMAWPGTWLEFDEPRVYDMFVEELRRDTHG